MLGSSAVRRPRPGCPDRLYFVASSAEAAKIDAIPRSLGANELSASGLLVRPPLEKEAEGLSYGVRWVVVITGRREINATEDTGAMEDAGLRRGGIRNAKTDR